MNIQSVIETLAAERGHTDEAYEYALETVNKIQANAWLEGWYYATNGKWDFPDPSECSYGPWEE